jgi:hypothetical protein
MKCFILAFVLILTASLLPAQQTTVAPSVDNHEVSASPAPAAHAPDEVTNKITGLVHDGKYAEAQQLTTALLVAYPDDQRLIKAKALLEKLLAPAGSANATPASNPPTTNVAPAQSATATIARQLTGMDCYA